MIKELICLIKENNNNINVCYMIVDIMRYEFNKHISISLINNIPRISKNLNFKEDNSMSNFFNQKNDIFEGLSEERIEEIKEKMIDEEEAKGALDIDNFGDEDDENYNSQIFMSFNGGEIND